MRITIITMGSRGDVQPYMALGLGLRDAGHVVTLATHTTFGPEIKNLGLGYAGLEGNIQELITSGRAQEVFQTGRNPLLFVRNLISAAEPLVMKVVAGILLACQGTELAILGGLGFYGGYDVAEKLGFPVVIAALQSLTPTRTIQNAVFPPAPRRLPLKGHYNRLTYFLFAWLFWLMIRRLLTKARRDILGLGRAPLAPPYGDLTRKRILSLYGVSPSVIPRPDDWPNWHLLTGYWFLDHDRCWQPPAGLLRFIETGPPPVYIGFGSMATPNPAESTQIVKRALQQVDARAILFTGWGGFSQPEGSNRIFPVEPVPHDWLFPRMAAVVHHGGAGTTAAGLRAGVPNVVIPFMGDQPFWADRVRALNAGPRPTPHKRLSASRLALALDIALNDHSMRADAAVLGEQIRAEDGVGNAVRAIHDHFGL